MRQPLAGAIRERSSAKRAATGSVPIPGKYNLAGHPAKDASGEDQASPTYDYAKPLNPPAAPVTESVLKERKLFLEQNPLLTM